MFCMDKVVINYYCHSDRAKRRGILIKHFFNKRFLTMFGMTQFIARSDIEGRGNL